MIEFHPYFSGSDGNFYVVSDSDRHGTYKLAIECGVPVSKLRQSLGFKVTDLDACLISHSHMDHAKSASNLLAAAIDCYASKETWSSLGIEHYRCVNIDDGDHACIHGRWTVRPFALHHDAGCLGFFVTGASGQSLIYMSDTCYSPYIFRGASVIAIEANHSEAILRANVDNGVIDKDRFARTSKNHMSIERCIAALKSWDLSKVRQIWLLHLSLANAGTDFVEQVERATGIPTAIAGGK